MPTGAMKLVHLIQDGDLGSGIRTFSSRCKSILIPFLRVGGGGKQLDAATVER